MSTLEINTGVRSGIAKIAALTGLVASIAACHAWLPPGSTMWAPVIFVSVVICSAFAMASVAAGVFLTLVGSVVLLVAWYEKPLIDPNSKEEPSLMARHEDESQSAPPIPIHRTDADPSSGARKGLGPYAPIKHPDTPKTLPAFDREPHGKSKSKKAAKPKSTTVAYQSSKSNKAKS